VTVNYTLPGSLKGPPQFDMPLMETPYEEVLVALVNVALLLDERRHWRITMVWDPEDLSVSVEPYS